MRWIPIVFALLSSASVANAQPASRGVAPPMIAPARGARLDPPYAPIPLASPSSRAPFDPELEGLPVHELRRLRYRVDVRGAITTTCISAAITLAGAITVLSEVGQRWERDQGILVAGAITSAIGGAGLIPSAFWLGHAAHRRRHLSRAIRDRLDRPTLRLAAGARGASLSIEGRF